MRLPGIIFDHDGPPGACRWDCVVPERRFVVNGRKIYVYAPTCRFPRNEPYLSGLAQGVGSMFDIRVILGTAGEVESRLHRYVRSKHWVKLHGELGTIAMRHRMYASPRTSVFNLTGIIRELRNGLGAPSRCVACGATGWGFVPEGESPLCLSPGCFDARLEAQIKEKQWLRESRRLLRLARSLLRSNSPQSA
jgi:hypothetical protein